MRITGSGTIEANVQPSGAGVLRGNDLVSGRDEVFIANFPNLVAVAAQFGVQQLFNPVGSGKIIIVDWLYVMFGSQVSTELWHTTVEMPTDVGDWITISDGATTGVAAIRSGTQGVVAGTFLGEMRGVSTNFAMGYGAFNFPKILTEGNGFAFVGGAVNEATSGVMIGREV